MPQCDNCKTAGIKDNTQPVMTAHILPTRQKMNPQIAYSKLSHVSLFPEKYWPLNSGRMPLGRGRCCEASCVAFCYRLIFSLHSCCPLG